MKQVHLYQNTPLKVKDKINLDASASHHLTKVLRFPMGKNITLFNGDGSNYTAKLLNMKQDCQVEILDKSQNLSESNLNITLVQGIAKGEKMDFIIQKAVELGVRQIIPMTSERCVVKLTHKKAVSRHQHWEKIIISACEQCQRSTLPHINLPLSFDECMQMDLGNKFVLHHRAQKSLLEFPHVDDACIIVGPEGGLSNHEIQQALSHAAQPLLLGKRVLRTETASLVALANMQLLWGS